MELFGAVDASFLLDHPGTTADFIILTWIAVASKASGTDTTSAD